MSTARLFVALGCIFIAVMSRLIPHPPDFTAVNTIALFGALYLNNRALSFITVFSSLFLSDILLGFHSTMPFVYLGQSLIILFGYKFKDQISIYRVPFVTLAMSILFFLVTDFGVWLTSGLYPKTAAGLALCYVAALPFLLNQILGDMIYGVLMYGSVYFLSKEASFLKISAR